MPMRCAVFLSLLLSLAVHAVSPPHARAGSDGLVFTIAVVPSAPPVAVHSRWYPLVERLSSETGLAFKIKCYNTMSDFEKEIVSPDAPDFIFANPLQTVVAHRERGYLPLVRARPPVWVELVVPVDSPADSIADLAGRDIAFVGSKSLCTVYMRHHMGLESGGINFRNTYRGSVKNVFDSVLLGKADAGSAFSLELIKQSPAVRARLRTVFRTPTIASHPLSAHPRVPGGVREVVTQKLISMGKTPAGQSLLTDIMLSDPVAADYALDYKLLEEIDIVGLSEWGK